jgi:hypothetical protein
MADYKQSAVVGTSWVRSYNVALMNPIDGEVKAVFHEETAVALGDGKTLTQSIGSCGEVFTPENAGESFNLIHPETGAVIGSATYQEVYVLMASLYLHVAVKRDAAVIAAAEAAAQAEADRLAALNSPPPADPVTPPAEG